MDHGDGSINLHRRGLERSGLDLDRLGGAAREFALVGIGNDAELGDLILLFGERVGLTRASGDGRERAVGQALGKDDCDRAKAVELGLGQQKRLRGAGPRG